MSLWFLTLVCSLTLSLVFVFGKRLTFNDPHAMNLGASMGGGASIAYVFVEILPGFMARQQSIESILGDRIRFGGERIFLIALVGFLIYYGLEYMAFTDRNHTGETASQSTPAYRVEIMAFAVYIALISYLVVHKSQFGVYPMFLYTIAMTFHCLVVDHSLRKERSTAYDRSGRWILTAAVLFGWVLGLVNPSVPAIWRDRLFAFIAGAVVFNSVKDELPDQGAGVFWAFVSGAVIFSILILLS